MLPSLTLEEESRWEGPGHSVYTQTSHELRRPLDMDIPAAVVINLPRTGPQFMQASTDILLYFPKRGQTIIYDSTYNDRRRNIKGLDIRSYGTFDSYLEEGKPREAHIKRYQYSVEFMPYLKLHGGDCPDKCLCAFHIYCDCSTYVELLINYDNDIRENETITLNWVENSSTKDVVKVATWYPERAVTKDDHILTWNTTKPTLVNAQEPRVEAVLHAMETMPLKPYMYPPAKNVPHIRGYHREDDE
jgi:hypothetical protein